MDSLVTITQYDLADFPLSWYQNELKEIEKALKKAVGSRWDNSRLRLDYYGIYCLQIHRTSFAKNSIAHKEAKGLGNVEFTAQERGHLLTNVYTWHLWDVRGLNALGNGTFLGKEEMPLDKSIIKTILEKCDKYRKGIYQCSDCKKEITKKEIAGTYFAGQYCSECWEREWKRREARETYN